METSKALSFLVLVQFLVKSEIVQLAVQKSWQACCLGGQQKNGPDRNLSLLTHCILPIRTSLPLRICPLQCQPYTMDICRSRSSWAAVVCCFSKQQQRL